MKFIKDLVKNSEGKKLGKLKRGWKDNINIILK
jgi:hypothetical protein